jgi:F-type H+-transporting ATPase subunit alpha
MKKDLTQNLTEQLRDSLPEDIQLKPVITEIGEITYVGDGICKIKGLPSAKIDDMVEVETSEGIVSALILGLSLEQIEAVVMGEYTKIKQGNIVRSRGQVLMMPAGEGMLGRVVDPLGNPMDGLGPIKSHTFEPVERLAPGVAKRVPVTDQFQSGILVVDTIIPLGKGQRELIIGDRKSGKTKLVEAFIMNQKGRDIICVYVAVGSQKARVRVLEEHLRQAGAMDYTCIVMGGSDEPPSINYIAPYAGTAIAEYFIHRGKDVIIFYDDLSKHAKAYRQMSLLLKRSPGRDAYPGDIFYLHSRLLERAARITKDIGGGSLTAFPMAETQNGDVSEYICTNLMSITDGHIYLDIKLMHDGILPAVDSGTSVSRIGGSVQPPALRKCGELASAQLARYNEVKSFETLNTEISEETEREIKRGKRILEIFAQDSARRLLNDEKTLLMYLVTAGKLDDVDLVELRQMKGRLLDFYKAGNYTEFKEKSETEKDMDAVGLLIDPIVKTFAQVDGSPAAKILNGEKPVVVDALPIVPINEPVKEGAETKPSEEKPAESAPAEKAPEGPKEESPKEEKK